MKLEHKKAFTLVELLVVIAIIALLMSILLPSLSIARKQAMRAVSQNNLRQQHTACNMYMDDYEGYFPYDNRGGTWYYKWGGKKGTEPGAATSVRLLNPYVCLKGEVNNNSENKQLHVFKSPADKGQKQGWYTISEDRMRSCWDAMGCSYLPNFSANNNDSVKGLWKKKITQVKNTHSLILVREMSCNAYFLTPGDGNEDELPFGYFYWYKNNYNGWGNVTFVDGHTEFLQATQDNPDFQNGKTWTFIINK